MFYPAIILSYLERHLFSPLTLGCHLGSFYTSKRFDRTARTSLPVLSVSERFKLWPFLSLPGSFLSGSWQTVPFARCCFARITNVPAPGRPICNIPALLSGF